MSEESPLVRQWILLRTLCARRYGATVKEMAEEMEVSERTIRRDLDTFLEAGFPLEETVGEHGRKKWHVTPGKNQPGLTFAFDEAVALYLGRRLMEPLAGTPFWEAAQRAFRKIRASLGEGALDYIDRFSSVFHQTMVGRSDYSDKTELIDQLTIGIEDHRQVFITYQSLQATESVSYPVYPYGLVFHHDSLYLIGKAPDHEGRFWGQSLNNEIGVPLVEYPYGQPPPHRRQNRKKLARSLFIVQALTPKEMVGRCPPSARLFAQALAQS